MQQQFSLYWTGSEWVDHAQYDRRKRFSPTDVEPVCQSEEPKKKLREYLDQYFGPDAGDR